MKIFKKFEIFLEPLESIPGVPGPPPGAIIPSGGMTIIPPGGMIAPGGGPGTPGIDSRGPKKKFQIFWIFLFLA